MNQYHNNNTRTYPRTMKAAFGPYTNNQLAGLRGPEPAWEKVAGYVLAVVIGVGLAALLVVGLSQ